MWVGVCVEKDMLHCHSLPVNVSKVRVMLLTVVHIHISVKILSFYVFFVYLGCHQSQSLHSSFMELKSIIHHQRVPSLTRARLYSFFVFFDGMVRAFEILQSSMLYRYVKQSLPIYLHIYVTESRVGKLQASQLAPTWWTFPYLFIILLIDNRRVVVPWKIQRPFSWPLLLFIPAHHPPKPYSCPLSPYYLMPLFIFTAARERTHAGHGIKMLIKKLSI